MATPLPCFKCGQELEPSLPGDIGPYNQPSRGTTFRAPGQYGSTVFDPNIWDDAAGFLELNICDRCLLEYKERLLFGHERRGPVSYDYEAWEPHLTLEQWEAWQERRQRAAASFRTPVPEQCSTACQEQHTYGFGCALRTTNLPL